MAFTRLSMAARVLLLMLACLLWCSNAEQQQRLLVDMTNVPIEKAKELGAYCLDGSLPAYHLHKGSGSGVSNWLLQFEGGGWCNDMATCLERAQTRRGSTRYMNKKATFSGILSNDPSSNPDFYNWNRVKLRYCDGASFAGDAIVDNGTSPLYFRGQKIWQAIIEDLLPQGLAQAEKALLSGCSAGGLAAFLHCNNFASSLPKSATVKCLGDAGFFIDVTDISNNYTARSFYSDLISLQGIEPNLDKKCTGSEADPKLCIFPQYFLKYTDVPFFVLNAAYDVYQFHHHFVPPSADPKGHWKRCKDDIAACRPDQLEILQNFRGEMIKALDPYKKSPTTGMYINSCFAHCQSESQDTWLAADSPKVENTGIAQAVGDWYFERNVAKLIDCPYPCDNTCHNLVESENKDKQED